MKLVILSCGSVASDVARRIAVGGGFDEMVVADVRGELADSVAASIGSPKVTSARFDATDPDSLAAVVRGADIVFNGVGPYYRHGIPILEGVLAAGAHYVDVCDEFDVAEELITNTRYDEAAKKAGLTVLTGIGASPGLTNLLARWAVDSLDSAHSVHVVLGLPLGVDMGSTINEHMLHSFDGEITQFLDGRYQKVPGWGDPRQFELFPPFPSHHRFGFMGHPESITVPHFVTGLREATSRFTWFQQEGVELYRTLARLGLTSTEELEGLPVSPRAFLSRFMATDHGRHAMSADMGDAVNGNVWHVEAEGELEGAPAKVVFEAHVLFDRRRAASGAALTAIPAAAGVRQLMEGRITRRGVVAPEGCIDPELFVRAAYAEMGVPLYRRVVRTEQLR